MVVSEDESFVYVIDFGLANQYRLPQSHIPYTRYTTFTGTTRFLSVNGHQGIEQSRRDDLESLAYVLIYFLQGSLPWQGLEVKSSKEGYARVMRKKIETTDVLGADLPSAFTIFLRYARSLAFDATPDYNHIRRLFWDALSANGFTNDGVFDWDLAGVECVGDRLCYPDDRLSLESSD
jgi:casein kinase I family protein HRR25